MELKKYMTLAAAVCSSGLVFAADQDMSNSQSRPAGHPDRRAGNYREITPPAGPRVSNGADVFVTADFIYWTIREDGLAFAFSGFDESTTNAGKGSVYRPDTKFEPGFKVGLGLGLGHDGWDLYAQYTWLQSSSSKSKTQEDLYPMWNIADNFNNPSSTDTSSTHVDIAKGDWSIKYNTIDLELGRNFYVSQYLALRPHVGLKGSWIDQDYTVRYTVDVSSTDQTRYKMENDQDTWSLGIRSGLDTAWHFTRNFSIFGDIAVSGMWTNFNVDRKDTSLDIITSGALPNTIVYTQNGFHSIKPMIEWALGLRWETWFNDDDYHFLLQAGWEEQVWVNFNNLFRLKEEYRGGELVLQGLTIEARFDF